MYIIAGIHHILYQSISIGIDEINIHNTGISQHIKTNIAIVNIVGKVQPNINQITYSHIMVNAVL